MQQHGREVDRVSQAVPWVSMRPVECLEILSFLRATDPHRPRQTHLGAAGLAVLQAPAKTSVEFARVDKRSVCLSVVRVGGLTFVRGGGGV